MSAEIDERTAAYIAETARDLSRRLLSDTEQGYYAAKGVRSLADDVAWLARQVAKLAESAR